MAFHSWSISSLSFLHLNPPQPWTLRRLVPQTPLAVGKRGGECKADLTCLMKSDSEMGSGQESRALVSHCRLCTFLLPALMLLTTKPAIPEAASPLEEAARSLHYTVIPYPWVRANLSISYRAALAQVCLVRLFHIVLSVTNSWRDCKLPDGLGPQKESLDHSGCSWMVRCNGLGEVPRWPLGLLRMV